MIYIYIYICYILQDYFTAVVFHMESSDSGISIIREFFRNAISVTPQSSEWNGKPGIGAPKCVCKQALRLFWFKIIGNNWINVAGQEATVHTRQETTDWFQIGKGVPQGCVLSPCLFNFMQNTSCEMPGWMKHKLESRLPGEILITSDIQMTPPSWKKAKKN